jgi:hypothetical protein
VYRAVCEQLDGGGFNPSGLLDRLEEQAAELLSRLIMEKNEGIEDPDRIIGDYMNVIKKNRQARKRIILMQELAMAEKNNDIDLVNVILKQLQDLGS